MRICVTDDEIRWLTFTKLNVANLQFNESCEKYH